MQFITTNQLDPNSLISGPYRGFTPPVRVAAVALDVPFGETAKCILCGVQGPISVKLVDGTDVTIPLVMAGAWFPITCVQVNTSGTTAEQIIWGS